MRDNFLTARTTRLQGRGRGVNVRRSSVRATQNKIYLGKKPAVTRRLN